MRCTATPFQAESNKPRFVYGEPKEFADRANTARRRHTTAIIFEILHGSSLCVTCFAEYVGKCRGHFQDCRDFLNESSQCRKRMQIQDMITGEKPAPWEVESKAPALAKRFGHLKGAILALLNRTPEARPSMAELQYACKRVLSHTTTTPSTILPSAAQPPAIPATAGQAKMENMPPPGPEQAVHSAQPETILIETNETEATLPDDSSGPRRKFSTSTTSTNVADSQTNINAPTTSESDVLPFPTTMNAISEDKPTV